MPKVKGKELIMREKAARAHNKNQIKSIPEEFVRRERNSIIPFLPQTKRIYSLAIPIWKSNC